MATEKSKPQIDIPRADEKEVVTLPSGYLGYMNKKVEHLSLLMIGVVIVFFLGFITLIIDSFHINSITYKEYSTQLEQYQKNQQTIIDLQNQLLQQK
jgi:Na+/melibiose symporter-like transporter